MRSSGEQWDCPVTHLLNVKRVRSPFDQEESVQAPPRAKGVLPDPVGNPTLADAPAHENNVMGDAIVSPSVRDHRVRVIRHVRRKIVVKAARVRVPSIKSNQSITSIESGGEGSGKKREGQLHWFFGAGAISSRRGTYMPQTIGPRCMISACIL